MASCWTLFILCLSALYTKSSQYERHSVERVHDPAEDIANTISQIFQLITSDNNQIPSQKKYFELDKYQRAKDRYYNHNDGRDERQKNHGSPKRYHDDKYNDNDRKRVKSHREYRPQYNRYPGNKDRSNRHRQYYQSDDYRHEKPYKRPDQQSRQEYRPNRGNQYRPQNRNHHECKKCNRNKQNSHDNQYNENQHRYNQIDNRAQQQSYEQNERQDRYQDKKNGYCSKCQQQNSNRNYDNRSKDKYEKQNRYNENQQYRDQSDRHGSLQEKRDYASNDDSKEVSGNNYEHKSRMLQFLLGTVEKLKCEEQENCINKCADTSDTETCQTGCEKEFECKRPKQSDKPLRCDDDCDTTFDPCAPSEEEITTTTCRTTTTTTCPTTRQTTRGGSTKGVCLETEKYECRCKK